MAGANFKDRHPWLTTGAEKLAKRLGENYVLRLVRSRGNVSTAFAELPRRMRLVGNQTALVLELIDDFHSGAYRKLSWLSIAVASAAVLYTVSPADVIPDAVPVIGQLDDLLAVAVAVRLLRGDLIKYCKHKGYDPEDYFVLE